MNEDTTPCGGPWTVMLPGGGVVTMTLDELDAAFDAGTVGPDTMVLAPDCVFWDKLGALAGLDERSAPAAPAAEPSLRPVAIDVVHDSVEIDLDVELAIANASRSKKKRVAAVLAAAVVAVAVAIGAGRSGSEDDAAPATAASPPPPPPAVIAEPVPTAPPAPAASTADASKRARDAVDKKTRKAAAAPKRVPSRPASPLLKGGDKHDPLNAAL